jgi:hypothetical protein
MADVGQNTAAQYKGSTVSAALGIDSTPLECRSCGRRLPIRLTVGEERAALWECVNCAAGYAGIFDTSAGPAATRLVQLGTVHFNMSRAAPIPAALREVATELAQRRAIPTGPERRREPRYPKDIVVPVTAVDDRFTPIGDPFPAILVNISPNGAGIAHAQPVNSEFLAFEIPSDTTIQAVIRISHSRPVGPFYTCGGPFVARFGTKPNG